MVKRTRKMKGGNMLGLPFFTVPPPTNYIPLNSYQSDPNNPSQIHDARNDPSQNYHSKTFTGGKRKTKTAKKIRRSRKQHRRMRKQKGGSDVISAFGTTSGAGFSSNVLTATHQISSDTFVQPTSNLINNFSNRPLV